METNGGIETLWRDLCYGARMLRKSPGFTGVAIITLALGIGANTAIFSLMNAIVLRPVRAQNPEQLVLVNEVKVKDKDQRVPTMAAFNQWRKHSRTLQDIALMSFSGDPTTLSGMGRAERVNEAYCGVDFFSLLGVKPFRGRFFLRNRKDQDNGVVISENCGSRPLRPIRTFSDRRSPSPERRLQSSAFCLQVFRFFLGT